MSSKPLIKDTLFLLNLTGLDCTRVNVLSTIASVLSIVIIGIAFVNILLEYILHYDGLNSVESYAGAVGFYQMIIKAVALIIYRKDFVELLNKIETFWNTDKFGPEIKNEIETIFENTKRMSRFMLVILVFALTTYSVQTFTGNTRRLYFKSFFPQDYNLSPYFEITLSSQIVGILIGLIIILGFDGLLIFLIINIICELKLLKEAFANVPINTKSKGDTKEALIYLYDMIDHHNLILECIKIMKQIYSLLLLNVYICNMGCICAGLLGLVSSGLPVIQGLTTYGVYTVFYILQLFYYCISGNYLTIECQSVSMKVFNTNWWVKTQPELRKVYILIIARANKVEELTAGGMFSLNLDGFRKVLGNALSFFTFVNAIYKDQVDNEFY